MQPGAIHEALNPLKWIMGTWRSINAEGSFPTIEPFTFCEEISFTSVGQPVLNYNSVTWHPTKLTPMHLESGFLRIKPGTNSVSFMVAHNFGLTSLEEGTVTENILQVKTSHIGRMRFGKDPKVCEIARSYKLIEEGKLELILLISTVNTPLDQHLKLEKNTILV
ncbi:THAP domain-containing protein 4-like isoform X2 [Anoplophora glabripennis]|uniref:THAP domain-containing protein 4-like isoform X2 n=1 Tax=Anoplophora glabripennis TaxID=217634 RepID=UPI000874A3BB|nr:THAP domain-containing protein 4-like isoform X2 [Anoplophora glabripennis]